MKVEIKLFGPQATLVGRETLSVAIDAQPVTVEALLQAIGAAEPALAPTLAGSRLAINHDYAAADEVIDPSDEVALIGMVSGG